MKSQFQKLLFLILLLSSNLFIFINCELQVTTHIIDTNDLKNNEAGFLGSESELEDCGSLGCGRDAARLILAFIFLIFVSMCVIYAVVRLNVHFVPESIAVVVSGVIMGIIIKYAGLDTLTHLGQYNPNDFFLILLPFIIFETGFSLTKYHFFKNIKAILILAIIGTVIAFLGTGFGLYGLGKAGLSPELSIFDCLLLSSILCATDPIATLVIFKALDVEPALFMIVLGESILNDAASVIIYDAVLDYGVSEIWKPILLFFGVFAGSAAVGVIIALLLALFLKYFDFGSYPALEMIFILIFSYSSYLISDSFYLSGILSSFFCGMTSSQYVYKSLSNETKSTVSQLFRLIAFVGETIVFIYIGIALPTFDFQVRVDLLAWTILLLLTTRGIATFPTFYILNKFEDKNKNKISIAIQIIIWVSGLRGAISFSLMEENEINEHSENAKLLKTNILLVVYVTLFVYGSLTYPLLKKLKITINSTDQTLESITRTYNFNNSRFQYIANRFIGMDAKLSRFFSRNIPPPRIDHIERDINIDEDEDDDGDDELESIDSIDEEDDNSNIDSTTLSDNMIIGM